VLTHTTGFPNWRPRGQPLKIIFPPGERFSYSGEGFVYLQKVVEHLTGQPLDIFMRQTVFEPLGMTSSSYVWQPEYETLKAIGHDMGGVPGERRKPKEPNAAASLQTTSLDYARFMIAIINGVGLKESTRNAMVSPQVQVDEGCSNCVASKPTGKMSQQISWGLGVGLQQTKDGLSFWHWGDNGDVHCYMLAFPKQKLGIVIFTNSANGLSIIPEIIAETLGVEQPTTVWLHYESYRSPFRLFYKDILARGAAAIDEYREKRKNKTATVEFKESQINQLGYALLYGAKRVNDAIAVFKLNTEDFPNSSNTYDSLGEAYMVAGEKDLAIRNYEKSVALDPKNANGIEALKKLRAP
jgi:CubicO group peptidase (beta-lactamase class C family)